MKHLALLLCLITLTGCSLTGAPAPAVTDSGSTNTGTQITIINTGDQFLEPNQGVDSMSGKYFIYPRIPTNLKDGITISTSEGYPFIYEGNVRVRSNNHMTQYTKNGGKTDICKNGKPLEYINPQLKINYVLVTVRCRLESSQIILLDTTHEQEYNLGDADRAYLLGNNNELSAKIGKSNQGGIETKITEITQQLESLEKRVNLEKDLQGHILFKDISGDTSLSASIGNGPLLKKIDNSTWFIPDYIPSVVQKIQLNKNLELQIITHSISCDWIDALRKVGKKHCKFKYEANLKLVNEDTIESLTGSIKGLINLESSKPNQRISTYEQKGGFIIISMPNNEISDFSKVNQLIFNTITKSVKTYDEILGIIRERESINNDIVLYLSIFGKEFGNNIEAFKLNNQDFGSGNIILKKGLYHRNENNDILEDIKRNETLKQIGSFNF